jgi:hypothetical protein
VANNWETIYTSIMAYAEHTREEAEDINNQLPPDLEIFDKRTAPVVETPQVTEQANGNFSMNHPAFQALGEPEAIEYLYSQKTGTLAFRPSDPNAPHAYRIRRQQNSLNYQFAGVAFHTHYGLPTGTAKRFRARMVGDALVVNLRETAKVVTHARRSKKKTANDAE